MDITEVRIKLVGAEQEERLLGFCAITIDGAFVVRDLKLIRGGRGIFVAMPSRKITDRCPGCGGKNPLRAAYCNECGNSLENDRSYKNLNGKAKLYSDIAHPIHAACRDLIQERVLVAYEQELILAREPSYVCRYEDYGEDDLLASEQSTTVPHPGPPGARNVRLDSAQSTTIPHAHRTRDPAITREPEDFGDGLF